MADIEAASVECRICQSSCAANLIQSPCLCKGSLGQVHIRCLEEWLSASAKNSCELCSHRFELVLVRRYNVFESVWIWISADPKIVYKAFALVFATCSILASLFLLWIRWIANIAQMIREEREAKERAKDHGDVDVAMESDGASFWLEGTVFFLYLVLMVALRIACEETCVLVRTQYVQWRRWWRHTCKVRLVLGPQRDEEIDKRADDFVEVDLNEIAMSNTSKSSLASFRDEESNLQSQVLPAVHKHVCNTECLV